MLPFAFRKKKTPTVQESIQKTVVAQNAQTDDEKTVFKIKAGSQKTKAKVDSKKTEKTE